MTTELPPGVDADHCTYDQWLQMGRPPSSQQRARYRPTDSARRWGSTRAFALRDRLIADPFITAAHVHRVGLWRWEITWALVEMP